MLESLGSSRPATSPRSRRLGNTGSVALPITMALGIEAGHLQPNERAALLGIGSGINALMLAVDWQKTLTQQSQERWASTLSNHSIDAHRELSAM